MSDRREEEFRAEVAGLRARPASPAAETRLLAGGVVLMVAGVALVLAGWVGASGTTRVDEQVPYLISGGLLGVAVVVVGGALFVRYALARFLRAWIVRLVHEQRVQTDRTVDALARVEALLAELASTERRGQV